jgi:hypothetical protein
LLFLSPEYPANTLNHHFPPQNKTPILHRTIWLHFPIGTFIYWGIVCGRGAFTVKPEKG